MKLWKFSISEETCEKAVKEVNRRELDRIANGKEEPSVSYALRVHGVKVQFFFAQLIGIEHDPKPRKTYDFAPLTNVVSRQTSANGETFRIYDTDIKDKQVNHAIPICVYSPHVKDPREFEYIGYFESADVLEYGRHTVFEGKKKNPSWKKSGYVVDRQYLREDMPSTKFLEALTSAQCSVDPVVIDERMADINNNGDGSLPTVEQEINMEPTEEKVLTKEEVQTMINETLNKTLAENAEKDAKIQKLEKELHSSSSTKTKKYDNKLLNSIEKITDERIREKLEPYFNMEEALTAKEWNNCSFVKTNRVHSIISLIRYHNLIADTDKELIKAFCQDGNLFRLFEFGSRWRGRNGEGLCKLGSLYVYYLLKHKKEESHPNITIIDKIEKWSKSPVSKQFRDLELSHHRTKLFEYHMMDLLAQSLEMEPTEWELQPSKEEE